MFSSQNIPRQKNRKVRLVEHAVERTARLLARQFGIRVVWKQGECKTNGNTIYLPTLPEDAPDELLEAVHGFLDHETAHILFTDFNAVKSIDPVPSVTKFHCINVIEDIRIESRICGIFPGSASNLKAGRDWLIPQVAEHWDSINQFMRACAAYNDYLNYGDTEFWKDTVDSVTKALVQDCIEAVGSHDRIFSTQEAIKAGLRMYEVLKDFAKEEEKESKERQKQQAENEAAIARGDEPKSMSPVSMGQLGDAISQKAASVVSDNGNGKLKPGAKKSGYTHNQANDSTYLVYSTELDTIGSMPDNSLILGKHKLLQIRDAATEITGVIKTKLVNSLRAHVRRRWVGGKEEGKVDSRRLYKAVLGVDTAVYKQRTDKVHLDTAVCFAIDHSGSMAGRKLDLAGQAAIVMGDALNQLKIPFAVYGYSTENPKSAPIDKSPYSRWSGLWIRYYRDFGESWESGASRLSGASHNVKNNTLDAESIKHGIRKLLARPEKRKILFVLNDGMPHPGYGDVGRCQQHLHDVLASAKAVGVEVVGFGIQDDDVKQYYANYVVIRRLEDLAAEPLKILDAMLRKGIKAK